ncbi:MAG: tetratricopeptide repeat protein [Acidobacteria bacterium]|nr:tetratricopeptide repeat protein [Acidobacteriota bacterium]
MPEKTITPSPKALHLARRLKLDPTSRVFYELAREHHALKNLDEAARLCREGLQRHPAYHSARVLLGKVLFDMGLFAEARPELERVVKQAPDNLLARRLLADALAGVGDRPGAVAALRQFLAIQPGDAEALKQIEELESGPPAESTAGLETLPRPEPEAAEVGDADEVVTPAPPEPVASTVMMTLPEIASTVIMTPSEAVASTVMMIPGEAVAATVMMTAPDVEKGAREEDVVGPPIEMAPPVGIRAPRDVRTTIMSPADVVAGMEAHAPSTPSPAHDASAATVMMRAPVFGADEVPAASHPAETLESALDGLTVPVAAPAAAGGPAAEPGPLAARDGEPVAHDDEPTVGALPTPTLAEIYLAQGMPERALEVYEAVLAGDPHNHEAAVRIRELRERLAPQGSVTQRKIQTLEGWLGRIRRLKDVQDDAGRSGPTSAGV